VDHAAIDLPTPDVTPRLPLPAPISTLPTQPLPRGDLVCYSLKDYQALALNAADALRWVKEARYRLDLCNGEKPK